MYIRPKEEDNSKEQNPPHHTPPPPNPPAHKNQKVRKAEQMSPASTSEIVGLVEALERLAKPTKREPDADLYDNWSETAKAGGKAGTEADLFDEAWGEAIDAGCEAVFPALKAGTLTVKDLKAHWRALDHIFIELSYRHAVLHLALTNAAFSLATHLRCSLDLSTKEGEMALLMSEEDRRAWKEETCRFAVDELVALLRRQDPGVGEEEMRRYREKKKEMFAAWMRLDAWQARIGEGQRRLDEERALWEKTVKESIEEEQRALGMEVAAKPVVMSPAEMIYRLGKALVEEVPPVPTFNGEPMELDEEEKNGKKEDEKKEEKKDEEKKKGREKKRKEEEKKREEERKKEEKKEEEQKEDKKKEEQKKEEREQEKTEENNKSKDKEKKDEYEENTEVKEEEKRKDDEERDGEQKDEDYDERLDTVELAVQRAGDFSAVGRAALFALKAALLCQVFSPPKSPGAPGPSRS